MQQSTNQFQKPLTLERNCVGNLEIGGCDLLSLTYELGTPLYVIDECTLRSICRDYRKAFSDYPKTKVLYASKALCTKAIAFLIDKEGFGFDVVSEGELYTVHSAGINMEKVLFNGSNKQDSELRLALDLGVGRISVDNFLELKKIDKLAKIRNTKIQILLRITPGIECHTHEYIQTGQIDSKFGFDLSQIDTAIELIQNEYENLNLVGLHAHVGSQIFEEKVFLDEIEILGAEIKRIKDKFGIQLSEINIGGGLGVKYTNEDTPPNIYNIGKLIIDKIKEVMTKYELPLPTLYIEPGRSMISTAGVTLYTIGSSKQVPNGRKYIAIDGGMADNPRPAMYQAVYDAEIANKREGDENVEKVTIAGRFCESGDILIENIELPEPKAGDVLCVYNTGAYNYSMASNYNRVGRPAMVLVNDEVYDVIIKRETLDDIVSHDVIPDRLI